VEESTACEDYRAGRLRLKGGLAGMPRGCLGDAESDLVRIHTAECLWPSGPKSTQLSAPVPRGSAYPSTAGRLPCHSAPPRRSRGTRAGPLSRQGENPSARCRPPAPTPEVSFAPIPCYVRIIRSVADWCCSRRVTTSVDLRSGPRHELGDSVLFAFMLRVVGDLERQWFWDLHLMSCLLFFSHCQHSGPLTPMPFCSIFLTALVTSL